MSVNIAKLAARLKQFEEGSKASEYAKLLWKPKEGKQNIRIVPYKFNPENPFIELRFYFKLGGNNYLAPCTFGKPDPILETIDALRASGSNEEKAIATKLAPVTRTYAPIIVRGEEELGVRYWGFGVQVYRQLLKLMTNAKYGDITSLTDGRDIEVEFRKESKKVSKDGQTFPETNILADPNTSPVVDPKRKDLLEKLKDQTDILKIFPLKSYDELKEIITRWLNPEGVEVESSLRNQEPSANAPATTAAVSSPSVAPVVPAPAAPTATPTDVDLAKEFEKFFEQ
ncbi:MAG TPA: hypothetical protein PLC59_00285 [Bacteroidales bacterium]|jgi:hypothetical protein|nr:hypothetical protein [Bacteroidales bacterium]HQI44501.1 hypothetical protein [Bacteroidales bacterium]